MKKRALIFKLLIIMIIIILAMGFFIFYKYIYQEPIGGQTDEHGCLGPAGYSWNQTEQTCVREWLSGNERYQITNFQQCIDAGNPAMESYPRQCREGDRTFTEEIQERAFCTEQDRQSDVCIAVVDPVCGWSDPEKIQCIKYPCANTYSNSCNACQDENVLYWTQGQCPEN